MSGKIIVFEGSGDGVGKSTQIKLLKDNLVNENYNVENYHFPSYGTPQASAVEMYLNGMFGNPEDISPYEVHSYYAIDRNISWKRELKNIRNLNHYLLFDRYTTSSIIYQSATFKTLEEKRAFVDYVIDFEYDKLKIPEPDLVLFLHIPFELVKKNILARTSNSGIANDIHETNFDYLQKVYETSLYVSEYLKWMNVKCYDGEEMDSIENIQEKIYSLAKKI